MKPQKTTGQKVFQEEIYLQFTCSTVCKACDPTLFLEGDGAQHFGKQGFIKLTMVKKCSKHEEREELRKTRNKLEGLLETRIIES